MTEPCNCNGCRNRRQAMEDARRGAMEELTHNSQKEGELSLIFQVTQRSFTVPKENGSDYRMSAVLGGDPMEVSAAIVKAMCKHKEIAHIITASANTFKQLGPELIAALDKSGITEMHKDYKAPRGQNHN